nr:telomere length regulation protein [Cryptococcus depauperatus CBS 7841]
MDPAKQFQQLKSFLRIPQPSIQDLGREVSSTLDILGIGDSLVKSPDGVVAQVGAIARYLPAVQQLLIQDTLPPVISVLDHATRELVLGLFVPSKVAQGIGIRRHVALVSCLTLPSYLNAPREGQPTLPRNMRLFLVSVLDRLTRFYGLDDVYHAVFSTKMETKEGMQRLQWEEVLKALVGIPAKVGNAVGRWKAEEADDVSVPAALLPKDYFDGLVKRLEGLMYELSHGAMVDTAPLQLVLEKLSAVGLLSSHVADSTSRTPSMLPSLLPPLLEHLHPPSGSSLAPYPPDFLSSIILSLPGSVITSFVKALSTHLTYHLVDSSSTLRPDRPDQRIKRAVQVLIAIVGEPKVGNEVWDALIKSITGDGGSSRMHLGEYREQSRNRLIVGWIGTGGESVAKAFIDTIVEAWTDAKYIKFSMYSQQFRLTHVLLLAISLITPYSQWLVNLSHRPKFILTFQSYLSHPDPSIRRLGMVVAEIMSELTVPETTQGMWDGYGDGKEEARWLRECVGVRDGDAAIDGSEEEWLLGWRTKQTKSPTNLISSPPPAQQTASLPPEKPNSKPQKKPRIVMLDPDQQDDPLVGYESSSPSSTRAPSPTAEYLEEIAADPSLGLDEVNKKKAQRPLYIPQLTALLKEREKPECVEMGLQWGEGLVRAKREFGTELAENAVGVTLMVLGLNDKFQIEEFEDKRQGLLSSLVACAPKQVAPFLIEQYFSAQFSVQHKFLILTALAMGARELAGLSVPQPQRTTRAIDFPTKTLPPALHNKYITSLDVPPNRLIVNEAQIDQAINGIRDVILSKGVRQGEETIPELARERRLRVTQPRHTKVAPVNSLAASRMAQDPLPVPVVAFKDIAAEYFVMPLINRFWHHFQDSSIREERALMMGARYRSAGTGMVLSPMVMEKFLMSLTLMLDSARHSPVFLSVLCPEALELAVTIGVRHPPRPKLAHEEDLFDQHQPEAQVLSAALELTLVCLDISIDLDRGRTLAMDHTGLIMAVGEWASSVFKMENEGGGVAAGQGIRKGGGIRAEAAGVVIKMGEIGEKWGHVSGIVP